MKIVLVDDEILALQMLEQTVLEVCPDAQLHTFSKASEALRFFENDTCDIVFLDICMRGMDGIELAQKLKDADRRTNIIFVTGYDSYTGEAMRLHASGYITKPPTAEKVRAEIDDLRYGLTKKHSAKLEIKCFGNFEVFSADGNILHFERSKAKEMFAYIVYRCGTSCTIREIGGILFEDKPYDRRQQVYLQKIASSMMQTLKNAGAEDIIVKNYNSISINTSAVECDYYRFLKNDENTIKRYTGEFMSQYSWAEYMNGYIEQIIRKK